MKSFNKLKIIALSLCLIPNLVFAGVDLTGDADRLSHGDGNSTDISGANQSITVACWAVKELDLGSVFVSKYNFGAAAQRSWELVFGTSSNKVTVNLSQDGTSISATAIGGTALTKDVWHHIAFVYNDIDIRIYLDGVLDSFVANNPKAYTAGLHDSTADFQIGADFNNDTPASFHNGKISDVAIWDAALSADEIALIYNSKIKGIPLQIQPANLQAYYPLDDFSDGTIGINTFSFQDRSGKGTVVVGIDGDGDSVIVAEEILSYP